VFRKFQQVHFVGIGGSGMSGIAEVLLNLGYRVSGSDLKRSAVTDRLVACGARVAEGHAVEHVGDAHVVVTSTAVHRDNPEVQEARRRGIPVIPRAEMLAELMRLKYGVAVAGSHGKTTTTSMVALVLDRGGLDPTVVVGGRLGVLGSGARLGRGDFMVAEADESDRSFLKLTPTIAVVTNIDREHLDTYRDLADVQDAFVGFLNKVPFYGACVLCLDDPPIQDVLPRIERRVVSYGLSPQARVSARDVALGPTGSSFAVAVDDRSLGPITLSVPGAHNVANALAAVAVGLDLELDFTAIRAGLESFTGVDRRFQMRGEAGGVLVIDDYGHHPTEIRATLLALREHYRPRRLVCVFQPHQHSRTRFLMNDFARSFAHADLTIMPDIYFVRDSEEDRQAVNAAMLVQRLQESGRDAMYMPTFKEITDHLMENMLPGDLIVSMGAGPVWEVTDELVRRLRGSGPA